MSNFASMSLRPFIVSVLWIHGRSIKEIAGVVQWTPGQVRGFTHREFKDPSRAHMKLEQRAELLQEMKAVRQDGGRLKEGHFKPIPRVDGQPVERKPLEKVKAAWSRDLAAARAIEDPDRRDREVIECGVKYRRELKEMAPDNGGFDPSTRDGRREARNFEQEIIKLTKQEEKDRETRQEGLAERRGPQGAALEFLFAQRLLRDAIDSGDKIKTSEEQRRLEAGMRLRKYLEGTRLGGLGAMDYERATMGSGGGAKISLSTYKLQCTHALGSIRQMMSQTDYLMIEAVVDKDGFIWEASPAGSRSRARIFDGIRHWLDIVAVHERLMTPEAYKARWDEDLPVTTRVTRGQAAAQSEAMAEFMEATR